MSCASRRGTHPRKATMLRNRALPRLNPPLQHRLRLRRRAWVGPMAGRAGVGRSGHPRTPSVHAPRVIGQTGGNLSAEIVAQVRPPAADTSLEPDPGLTSLLMRTVASI